MGENLTALGFRSEHGEGQGSVLIFLFSSKLSEKSDVKPDCEQLHSELSPGGKEQHVKVGFKLSGVHWTIADKILKQGNAFRYIQSQPNEK